MAVYAGNTLSQFSSKSERGGVLCWQRWMQATILKHCCLVNLDCANLRHPDGSPKIHIEITDCTVRALLGTWKEKKKTATGGEKGMIEILTDSES